MKRWWVLLLTVVALSPFMVGCAPVKGYLGPELPESEVAVVSLDYDSDTVSVNEAGIEGTAFGVAGIHILPGRHLFDLQIDIRGPLEDCHPYSELDGYSYERCLDKKERWKCDCYDFLEVRRHCERRVRDGVCSGDFETAAGRQYSIRVQKNGQGADASVYERAGPKAGKGRCHMGDWRTEEEDEYIGKGRSTAHSHGIYSCY